jgi:phage FluMu protein Com
MTTKTINEKYNPASYTSDMYDREVEDKEEKEDFPITPFKKNVSDFPLLKGTIICKHCGILITHTKLLGLSLICPKCKKPQNGIQHIDDKKKQQMPIRKDNSQ